MAGALGPTNRTASLSPDVNDPAFAQRHASTSWSTTYGEATRALIEGGVDLHPDRDDLRHAERQGGALRDRGARRASGVDLPIIISGTITDASGRTLSGQTVEAFWNSVRHARPLAVGLNCALGAKQLRPYVEELSRIARCLRQRVSERRPAERVRRVRRDAGRDRRACSREFARSGFLNIVGGCCGTTPEHIRAHRRSRALELPPRKPPRSSRACGLSGSSRSTSAPDSLFVNVGERTNVTGSAKFRKLIEADDYDDARSTSRASRSTSGAQIIDVNMDEGMLDSEAAMMRFLNLIAAEPDIARVPVMVDSSKWSVIEAGLKCLQGKGVVNSI